MLTALLIYNSQDSEPGSVFNNEHMKKASYLIPETITSHDKNNVPLSSKSGLMEEQYKLFTAEPSFQTPRFLFVC